MNTVDRLTAVVNHVAESVPPGQPVSVNWTDGQNRPIVLVTILVAIMLLGGALKYLGRAVAPIGELVRMVLSALAVAALLICAIAVLVVMLFVTAGNQ